MSANEPIIEWVSWNLRLYRLSRWSTVLCTAVHTLANFILLLTIFGFKPQFFINESRLTEEAIASLELGPALKPLFALYSFIRFVHNVLEWILLPRTRLKKHSHGPVPMMVVYAIYFIFNLGLLSTEVALVMKLNLLNETTTPGTVMLICFAACNVLISIATFLNFVFFWSSESDEIKMVLVTSQPNVPAKQLLPAYYVR